MQHGTIPPETDDQAIDTIFSLLRHRYRRDVVEILSERESPLPLRDLAATIAAGETESDRASTETTHEVATALHHVHLPKLDDADVIDYDTETSTVTPVRTDALVPFLTLTVDGQ